MTSPTNKVKKAISADRTCIDYTHSNFGVRVWKDKCQVIGRQEESAPWQTREEVYALPVENRFQSLPICGGLQPVPALAMETRKMEQHHYGRELRNLLHGDLSFEGALNDEQERMIGDLIQRGPRVYGFKMFGDFVVIVGPGEPENIGTPTAYSIATLEAGLIDGRSYSLNGPTTIRMYTCSTRPGKPMRQPEFSALPEVESDDKRW